MIPTYLIVDQSRDDRSVTGAWISLGAVQFFIAQAIVQSGWTTPFSLAQNFISDLGNTACAPYPPESGGYVCSPWHSWMNASFIVVGLTIIAGPLLMRSAFRPGPWQVLGIILLAMAGPGVILVGLFPENINGTLHRLGAGSNFVLGNLGIGTVGTGLLLVRRWRPLALFSLASGLVGLAATAMLVSGVTAPGGIGTVERFAAYPIPLWLMVAGGSILLYRDRPEEIAGPRRII